MGIFKNGPSKDDGRQPLKTWSDMVCLSSLGVWEEVCNCCFIKFIGKSGGRPKLKMHSTNKI